MCTNEGESVRWEVLSILILFATLGWFPWYPVQTPPATAIRQIAHQFIHSNAGCSMGVG